MVACKIILAVAVVSVAFIQINAKPADTDWALPFEAILKNFTSKFSEVVTDPTELTNLAKNSINTFSESFKAELATFQKTLEGKAGVTDLVKDSVKQWQTNFDAYTKNVTDQLSLDKINEKFDQTLKIITQSATELYKKAQGNTAMEKEIKEFTKKQIDAFLEQVKTIQSKGAEKKP